MAPVAAEDSIGKPSVREIGVAELQVNSFHRIKNLSSDRALHMLSERNVPPKLGFHSIWGTGRGWKGVKHFHLPQSEF
jgi:hypothetical protein